MALSLFLPLFFSFGCVCVEGNATLKKRRLVKTRLALTRFSARLAQCLYFSLYFFFVLGSVLDQRLFFSFLALSLSCRWPVPVILFCDYVCVWAEKRASGSALYYKLFFLGISANFALKLLIFNSLPSTYPFPFICFRSFCSHVSFVVEPHKNNNKLFHSTSCTCTPSSTAHIVTSLLVPEI